MVDTTSIEGRLECNSGDEATLAHIAESVDKFVGAYPRLRGYDLAVSMAAILNGGTHDQIEAAFRLLRTWEFMPKEGW